MTKLLAYKKWLNYENLGWPILSLFTFSVFFSVRYVFFTTTNYLTGVYSDFTAISLYLSDIFLFFILLLLYFSPEKRIYITKYVLFWSIWVFLSFITTLPHYKTINIWFILKNLEMVVAYGTLLTLFTKNPNKKLYFIRLFVTFTSFQAIIAISQFILQKSTGFLHILGEPVFNTSLTGVAKIITEQLLFVRSYGTFPHPNLLSAFLVTGILFICHLILNAETKVLRIIYSVALLVNLAGLGLTFSRAGFIALGAGLAIFFGYYLLKSSYLQKKATTLLFITILSIVTVFFALKPFILTRATVTDSASVERVTYTKIGIRIIADNPVFGVGIGESVLHMQQYATFKLEPWQNQPIHNYFLLIAAEVGIPGMLLMGVLLLWHFKVLVLSLKHGKGDSLTVCLLAVLTSFVVLMQFDHYFYTLQQTQLLLWAILALTVAHIKNSPQRE